MNKKLKILISVGSLGVGGNELFVMNFFRHINRDNIQMDFITYDSDRLDFEDEIKRLGGKVYIVKTNVKNKYARLFSQMIEVRKVLKIHHYDIIHCHSCSFVGLFRGAVPGFITRGTKVITHSHNPGMPKDTIADSLVREVLKKILCSMIDMGFSCSDYAGISKYTSRFMKSSKYHVIHNAIEVEKYKFDENHRNTVRDRLGVNQKIVIGNVGRLAEQKNQSFLLDIFYTIKQLCPEAFLLIIGDGVLKSSLQEKAQNLGIIDDVCFTGTITDVNAYYSAMDVFVMPSLYEGLPFTAIEAQVNGLKCVISDSVTKMTDVTGDTCFVSLSLSAEEWAKIILKIGERRSTPEKIMRVLQDYNIYSEAIKLERLYIDCVKGA